ncbi:FlxA-like family protein [Undibacterium sp. TJN25]|uniref:FlxA-like family protein n=1 Tax=Undibacterium sp. TJN25 TaxID=3413056 RepID=UPI003BF2EF9E
MVQAIAPDTAAATSAASSGSASAALQAQLDRYQKELSDCVNCASAKTPEGKTQIDDISSKISDLKSRIDKVGNAKASDSTNQSAGSTGKLKDHAASQVNNKVNESTGTVAATATAAAASSAAQTQNTASGTPRPGSASLTVGGFLDFYA